MQSLAMISWQKLMRAFWNRCHSQLTVGSQEEFGLPSGVATEDRQCDFIGGQVPPLNATGEKPLLIARAAYSYFLNGIQPKICTYIFSCLIPSFSYCKQRMRNHCLRHPGATSYLFISDTFVDFVQGLVHALLHQEQCGGHPQGLKPGSFREFASQQQHSRNNLQCVAFLCWLASAGVCYMHVI